MTRRGSISAAMVLLFALLLPVLIESGCTRSSTGSGSAATQAATARTAASEAYTPGLGEIMTLQQMRHVKLWLAGEAGNWDLAAYEIKELGEGFDDVVKFHPTHEDSPVAPKDAIPRMMTGPLGEVQAAVAKKDARSFEQTYDALTKACNSCHQATNFSFNVVQRPAMNPYPNQSFAPVAR
jgi:hypothetical protein